MVIVFLLGSPNDHFKCFYLFHEQIQSTKPKMDWAFDSFSYRHEPMYLYLYNHVCTVFVELDMTMMINDVRAAYVAF